MSIVTALPRAAIDAERLLESQALFRDAGR